jgi:transposase
MMVRKKKTETENLWIVTKELALPSTNVFYTKLDELLASINFGDQMRALCAPCYSKDDTGRPPIDPEVYFKMHLVGFFENIPSERGIAYRCLDSLAVRSFLHYSLTEYTPDHSSLSVIRKRLPEGIFGQMFSVVLAAMKKHGLVKGKNLAFDTSVIEANASLKSLVNRMTEESYKEYVKALAAAAGVDTTNAAAVANFDRKRAGKKLSNEEWKNPHDPDAKIGMTKDGATDMIYKPEHVVDLDTGAIIDVSITAGDKGDTDAFEERVLTAQHRLNSLVADPLLQDSIETITADKGYYKTEQLAIIRGYDIAANIPDKLYKRNLESLCEEERNAVNATVTMVESEAGKELLKSRGKFVERSFAHCLDCGGARQTTLRGSVNIEKRHFMTAAFFNISLLMRKLCGVGTARQFASSKQAIIEQFEIAFTQYFGHIVLSGYCNLIKLFSEFLRFYKLIGRFLFQPNILRTS